jgi:hypothetical protein
MCRAPAVPSATSSSWPLHASPSPFPGPAPLPYCPLLRVPRPPELLPAANSPPPCSAPAPALFPSLFCPAALADSTRSISLALALHAHPELPERRRRFASTLASHWPLWVAHPGPPRTTTTPWELPLTPLTLPGHSSQSDPHRNQLTVATGTNPSGFLSSCCSYWTRTWPPSSPGNPSPTSPSSPPPRPLWEPHLRSYLPLPKTARRCALSSWCSLAAPSPPPAPPLAGIWPANLLPLLPRRARTQLL